MLTAKIVIIVSTTVLLFIVLIAAAVGGIASMVTGTGSMSCTLSGSTTTTVDLAPSQAANASLIVAAGKQLGVPEQGWVVAIATAMQESALENLDHGDRDSLGLFQQRPSQGWGTPAQITSPVYAATQFYRHLLAVPGWQQMSVNDAAQAVQRSGTPTAYAQHERAAREVLAAVGSASC